MRDGLKYNKFYILLPSRVRAQALKRIRYFRGFSDLLVLEQYIKYHAEGLTLETNWKLCTITSTIEVPRMYTYI
jgi:hypothetical protein